MAFELRGFFFGIYIITLTDMKNIAFHDNATQLEGPLVGNAIVHSFSRLQGTVPNMHCS